MQEAEIYRYFKCPICGKKHTKIHNRQGVLLHSWCDKCGRCFEVKWVEEKREVTNGEIDNTN